MHVFRVAVLGLFISACASGAQADRVADGAENTEACGYDEPAMLALDFQAFDQDLDGGWRPLADDPDCLAAAAELLAAWREEHGGSLSLDNLRTIYWHEGQVRALAGDTPAALPLLARSFRRSDPPLGLPDDVDADWRSTAEAWNAFADATIAFLQGDLDDLQTARDRLAAVPPPPSFDEITAQMRTTFDLEVAWPPNLDGVEALLICFGEPYAAATGPDCQPEVAAAD